MELARSIEYSESRILQLGRFKIDIDSKKALITISAGSKIVWSTLPGSPFLLASQGHDTFESDSGNFKITEVDHNVTIRQTVDVIEVTTELITIKGKLDRSWFLNDDSTPLQYTFTFSILPLKNQLQFDATIQGPAYWNTLHLIYGSDANEGFFGFGEQFSWGNLKGQKVPIFVREQGAGRGSEPLTTFLNAIPTHGRYAGGSRFTTYAPMPHYVTTESRSLFLTKGTTYSSFDLQRDRVILRQTFTQSIGGRIVASENMMDAINEYAEFTGHMRSLPKWIGQGAIAAIQGGEKKVLDIVERMKKANVPVVALWLQDWVGKREQQILGKKLKRLWWNWLPDDILYPNWNTFVKKLQSDYDIRTLCYINCFLADVSMGKTTFKHNLFAEAREKGYLAKRTINGKTDAYIVNSGPNFQAGILDLSNPSVTAWLKDHIKKYVFDVGCAGYMADFGEYLPLDAVLDSATAEVFHNQYPVAWAKLHDDIVKELQLTDEAFIFHRSAFVGSQRHMNAMWVGDQNCSWDIYDGIKSAVTGMLAGSISGLTNNHSDIGGYTTFDLPFPGMKFTRSQDLFMRWCELAAFTCIYRTHEGNAPDANTQFYSNDETMRHFGHCARLFIALDPYRSAVLKSEHIYMRHLVLHYHDSTEEEAKIVKDDIVYEEFLLGGDVLVAPVLDARHITKKVYLPSGRVGQKWQDLWTERVHEGGRYVTVEAPLGRPPIFARYPIGSETFKLLQPVIDFCRSEAA